MEDFKSWSLDCLIDLWVDMTTPDFDILKVTDKYHNKKLQIAYIISEKIDLSYKDTMVMLNTKRVAKEEIRNYYYRQNRIYYEKKERQIKFW